MIHGPGRKYAQRSRFYESSSDSEACSSSTSDLDDSACLHAAAVRGNKTRFEFYLFNARYCMKSGNYVKLLQNLNHLASKLQLCGVIFRRRPKLIGIALKRFCHQLALFVDEEVPASRQQRQSIKGKDVAKAWYCRPVSFLP